MKQDFIEKIYAGWLAKIIGIRLAHRWKAGLTKKYVPFMEK